MSELKELIAGSHENQQVTQSPSLGRRGFLRTVVKGAAGFTSASIFPPRTTEAASDNSPSKQPETDIQNWDNLLLKLNQLKSIKPGDKDEIEREILNLKDYDQHDEVGRKRRREFRQIVEEDWKKNGADSLFGHYQRLVQGMRYVQTEDIFPYDMVGGLTDDYLEINDFLNYNLYLEKSPDSAKKKLAESLAAQRAEKLKAVAALEQDEATGNEIAVRKGNLEMRIVGDPKKLEDPEIQALATTTLNEAEETFDDDPITVLPTKFRIFDIDKMGGIKQGSISLSVVIGSFDGKQREQPDNRSFGAVSVDIGKFPSWKRQYIYRHEIRGHGSDISMNKAFARNLSPEEVYMLALIQTQAKDNPNWGNQFDTIDQLMRLLPRRKSDPDFYREDQVNDDEFIGAISQYPVDLIAFNNYNSGITIYDRVYMHLQKIDSRTEMSLMEHRAPLNFSKIHYTSVGEFFAEALPLLASAAKKGDRRAAIIHWGLKHYAREFEESSALLNDPFQAFIQGKQPIPVSKLRRYLDTAVLNLSAFQIFGIGGEGADEVRIQFSPQAQEFFEREKIYLIRKSMQEGWAEARAMYTPGKIAPNIFTKASDTTEEILKQLAARYSLEDIKNQTGTNNLKIIQ